jgi:uncharacterized Tic20 family protein
MVGLPLGFLVAMVASARENGSEYAFLIASILCVTMPMAIGFIALFIMQVFNVLQFFFSYLGVDADGIEIKIWLYRHIRVPWSEVDRKEKFFFYDVIYFKSYEVAGFSLSQFWPWKAMKFFQSFIALYPFQGWSTGLLADDLKRYAPHLFEAREPILQAGERNSQLNNAAASQDTRLLAALGHVSILFSGIGIFVPLVIYLTQRKKSAFLAFHSLQAFIYQLVIGVIYAFFQTCLVLGVWVPLFLMTLTKNETTAGITMLIDVIAIVVGSIIFMFSVIAAEIYGIIGAVMTYQGKDFRYAIIGKRLLKK